NLNARFWHAGDIVRPCRCDILSMTFVHRILAVVCINCVLSLAGVAQQTMPPTNATAPPAQNQPAQQPPTVQGGETGTPGAGTGASASVQQPERQLPSSIIGTVTDQVGDLAVGAQVQLTRQDQSPKQEVLSGDNGQFSFPNLPPGPFKLTISAPGFDTQAFSGDLGPSQVYIVPAITLAVTAAVTEVRVGGTQFEVAAEELKEQEKQRVFGFIPNFYVTYVSDPAPLASRQKFQLAWRSVIDPFTFVGVGFLAGIDQASDQFGGYGQGAEGYAKRFGAAYGPVVASTVIACSIPTPLLKQSPCSIHATRRTLGRWILYALAKALIRK